MDMDSTAIAQDLAVDDVNPGACDRARQIDAVAREPPDGALTNGDPSAGKDPDPVKTIREPFDVEPFKVDPVARVGNVDSDAIDQRREDAARHAVADDGDRLRDGHRAEAARIEAVDLAVA